MARLAKRGLLLRAQSCCQASTLDQQAAVHSRMIGRPGQVFIGPGTAWASRGREIIRGGGAECDMSPSARRRNRQRRLGWGPPRTGGLASGGVGPWLGPWQLRVPRPASQHGPGLLQAVGRAAPQVIGATVSTPRTATVWDSRTRSQPHGLPAPATRASARHGSFPPAASLVSARRHRLPPAPPPPRPAAHGH